MITWTVCKTTQQCEHAVWRGFHLHAQPGEPAVWSANNPSTQQLKTGVAPTLEAAKAAVEAAVAALTVDPALCIIETARPV